MAKELARPKVPGAREEECDAVRAFGQLLPAACLCLAKEDRPHCHLESPSPSLAVVRRLNGIGMLRATHGIGTSGKPQTACLTGVRIAVTAAQKIL